ncbi:MAG TPA: lasso peptide biosynthesis B2 protein [Dongiaceae bacterium]|nr:lasso peptide biosynthesis B2 protein [Dongiaceae bacterium]
MWARLRRFSALPRREKALFLQACALLPCVKLSLALRGFGPTRRFFLRTEQERKAGPDALLAPVERAAAESASRMVLAAVRNSVLRYSCLERALTLSWLLARQGIVSRLRIGVRKDGEKFEAHAWVECGGAVLAEPESAHLHYAAFAEEFSGLGS